MTGRKPRHPLARILWLMLGVGAALVASACVASNAATSTTNEPEAVASTTSSGSTAWPTGEG